jgi:hypothetical protein
LSLAPIRAPDPEQAQMFAVSIVGIRLHFTEARASYFSQHPVKEATAYVLLIVPLLMLLAVDSVI